MSNGKLKVLHISQVSGGIKTYIEQIVKHLNPDKFECIIACPNERKDLIQLTEQLSVKHVEIGMRHQISPIKDIKSILEIISLVKKEKPHVIHAHSSKAGVIVRIASLFFRTKVLYTPNAFWYLGLSGIKRKLFYFIEKWMKLFTYKIVVSSPSEYSRSVHDLHFSESKLERFYNSIEILPLQQLAARNFSEKKLVTTVGRLVPQKNPLMFVQVCHQILKTTSNIQFQIIGAGFEDRLREEIEAYIALHNLGHHITIKNWMTKQAVLQEIRRSDVFVMTSRFEGLVFVGLESQMLEIPMVCTKVDGLFEIIEDGKTGFAFDLNDVDGMAKSIISLCEDTEKNLEMGQRGRKRISELFDIEKNIVQLEEIYHQASLK